jgi:hypothetical protein
MVAVALQVKPSRASLLGAQSAAPSRKVPIEGRGRYVQARYHFRLTGCGEDTFGQGAMRVPRRVGLVREDSTIRDLQGRDQRKQQAQTKQCRRSSSSWYNISPERIGSAHGHILEHPAVTRRAILLHLSLAAAVGFDRHLPMQSRGE